MRLLKNGKNILNPEITNISKHGFWVFMNSKEFFLSYDKYPYFFLIILYLIDNFTYTINSYFI